MAHRPAPGRSDVPTASPRRAGLARVQQWFAPAFAPDEVLRAAVAATPFRLTMLNSLRAIPALLVGRSTGRVLLLTDRAVHVAARQLWRRRFKKLLGTYPVESVAVSADGEALCIGEHRFYPNPAGYQLGGGIGSTADIELFVEAGRRA